MKKGLAALAVLLLALALWLLRVGEPVEVTIPEGQSAGRVAQLLKDEGVIGSPFMFKALAKATRLDRSLKPGVFRLRRRMSSAEALWRLATQEPQFIRVVIPEGFSALQIAERLEAAGIVSAADFLAYAEANRLEGHLLPATYNLARGMTGEAAAHRMVEEFRRATGPLLSQPAPGGLSAEQVVALASIVEREAVIASERPLIAAVYLNRLQRRQPLEADPTVQYAIGRGRWKKALSRADLHVDSPYNTYRRPGLPPGPICSPGLHSIRAVLDPARVSYLYFVADNTGGHAFSVTFEEHLRAKERARRERRSGFQR